MISPTKMFTDVVDIVKLVLGPPVEDAPNGGWCGYVEVNHVTGDITVYVSSVVVRETQTIIPGVEVDYDSRGRIVQVRIKGDRPSVA